MIRQYFKLNPEDSESLVKQYYSNTEDNVKEQSELINQFKSDFHTKGRTVFRTLTGGSKRVIGYEVKESDRVPKWAKQVHFYEDSERFYYLEPKLNFKRGKEFQAWLDKINSLMIPSFSEYVVEQTLGGQPCIVWGMKMHYAVAGYIKDHVTLSVPTTEQRPVKFIGDLKFEPIKKSEYIAITEE